MGWDCVVEYSKEYKLKSSLENIGCDVKLSDGRYVVTYNAEQKIDENIRDLFSKYGESKIYEVVKYYN